MNSKNNENSIINIAELNNDIKNKLSNKSGITVALVGEKNEGILKKKIISNVHPKSRMLNQINVETNFL